METKTFFKQIFKARLLFWTHPYTVTITTDVFFQEHACRNIKDADVSLRLTLTRSLYFLRSAKTSQALNVQNHPAILIPSKNAQIYFETPPFFSFIKNADNMEL